MFKNSNSCLHLLFAICLFLTSSLAAQVKFDPKIPQEAFAAQEVNQALRELGRKKYKVTLTIEEDKSRPEAFQIRVINDKKIEIVGSDATGVMYGGIEVAELLRIGLPIEDHDQKPFLEKRGVKINIPIDVRIPAFADGGEAAQRNVKTMWDIEFWKEYLDDLARYRYNVLSLWAAHPFPAMIKLEDYPDVAMENVHYIDDIPPGTQVDPKLVNKNIPGTMNLVMEMSIDEKIDHWQKVFNYANDRGIEIVMVHWNVFTYNATGKYGITPEQDNPITIEYLRKCISQMLLTYPQITAVGVCAGENDDEYLRNEYMTENLLFNSYGKGIMDVKELQPDREIGLIIRRHSTEYSDINEAFKDYTGGNIEISMKYAVAHMYSSRRPQEWEKRVVDEGWLEKYKVWLNLRNDDIFMHRWGSPDYARDFINWIPHEYSPGFYMGSDTYVWGREFISKNPETAGWLEIKKHWYRDRLWGQLAYNNELGDDYWQAVLKHRFPGADAKLLLEAWESVSEVIPQLNRSVWSPTDGSFGAEACRRTSGFLTVDGYQFERPAMILNRVENAPDPQCITVVDWARAILKGEQLEGETPLQVADNLDGYAKAAQDALPALRAQMGNNVELKETLNDIESMAFLGRYYADKMRGAAKLALYREGDRQDDKYLDEAISHMEDAVEEWKAYAAVLTPQYRAQLGARANNQDWNGTLKEVEKEVENFKEEGDYPVLRFANLSDGAKLKAGSDLRVEIEATDGNGTPNVKLRLSGLTLNAGKNTGDFFVWDASSDELLKSLKKGMYHLEAEVVDKNGFLTSGAINIQVGDASQNTIDDWKNEIYAVVLNEGEIFRDGDILEFPRLECTLNLSNDGSFSLEGGNFGTRGRGDRPKWKTMKQPNPYHFYAIFEDGQLQVHRKKDGYPKMQIYESRLVEGQGPFKLGVTLSKNMVIFREADGKKEIVREL